MAVWPNRCPNAPWKNARLILFLFGACRPVLPLQNLAMECASPPVVARKIAGCAETPDRDPARIPGAAIARICPPGEKGCESAEYQRLAGSGGARVKSFFTQRTDPKSRSIRVGWRCPQGSGTQEVRVTLRNQGRIWEDRLPCSAEHRDWPASAFAIAIRQPIDVLVQLPADITACTVPINLLAQLSTPPNYFVRRTEICRNLTASNACLVIDGVTGTWRTWEIRVGGVARDGSARLPAQEFAVPIGDRCRPADVYVDVDRTKAERTCIGELRF
jgi:hypothetical protein